MSVLTLTVGLYNVSMVVCDVCEACHVHVISCQQQHHVIISTTTSRRVVATALCL